MGADLIKQLVDPKVKGEIAPEGLRKFCEISCLNDEGTKRPSVNDVVWSLVFILQLQESIKKEGDNLRTPDGLGEDKDEEAPVMMPSSGDMITLINAQEYMQISC